MNRIYVPSRGPQDWRELLAKPDVHWKHGASAMALADTWEAADSWPPEVETALEKAGLDGLDLLLAIPEHQTPLPGNGRTSQTDLLVLARRAGGTQVVLAVEGKAAEPFGRDTVAEWRRRSASEGRTERLAFLLERLGLADDETTAARRYQLLHRTTAALLEAERFGAPEAVMLVHSFSRTAEWHGDYARLAQALGAELDRGIIAPARVPGPIRLHLGWVTGAVPPLREQPGLSHRVDSSVGSASESARVVAERSPGASALTAQADLEIPEPDNTVAEQLGRVARALAQGEAGRAAAELAGLAGVTSRAHPIEPMPTLPREGWPKATHGQTRNPAVPVIARTYVQDRFTCVYCGRWTIPTQLLRLISHALPTEFPYHPNWKMDIAPRAYWDISTSLDHVRAVSMGGDYQDPTNLATACARCQYQKGNLPLETLGWSVRRDLAGWSGLIDEYAPLWERLGRPDAREHSTWIRAFNAARAALPEPPPAV